MCVFTHNARAADPMEGKSAGLEAAAAFAADLAAQAASADSG
ncbi:MAG: hypothetical protein WDO74_19345 [Pseudomonadota bacterium]